MDENAKYQLTINDHHEYNWTAKDLSSMDLIAVGENQYHIIKDQVSYTFNIKSFDRDSKHVVVNIDGKDFSVSIKDKYDLLINKLGLSAVTSSVEKNIKAPMPGLVLEVKVKVGDEVEEGDALLILEAMKMENVIKSGGNATISAIHIDTSDTVDKGQLLIEME